MSLIYHALYQNQSKKERKRKLPERMNHSRIMVIRHLHELVNKLSYQLKSD
jgi:hypothetical protein